MPSSEDHYESLLAKEASSDASEDELGYVYRTGDKRKWLSRNKGLVVSNLILFCIYLSTVGILFRRLWVVKDLQTGSSEDFPSYSPANQAVRYKAHKFNAEHNSTSAFVGEPKPSIDMAWHKLLENLNMRISAKDLEKVNRSSIPLGIGGGYYAVMNVFHELHCLKYIRQNLHYDYYGKYMGEREMLNRHTHVDHCIELIRQSLICRADTTLITFHWGDTVKVPQPDTGLLHKCVDWDHLMEWAEKHRIDAFEEGMMIHPKFGPSFPGGLRDDRPPPNPAEVDPPP